MTSPALTEELVRTTLRFAAKDGIVLETQEAIDQYLLNQRNLTRECLEDLSLRQWRKLCEEYRHMVRDNNQNAGPSSSPIARTGPSRDAVDEMMSVSDSGFASIGRSENKVPWPGGVEELLDLHLLSSDDNREPEIMTAWFHEGTGSLITPGAAARYDGMLRDKQMKIHWHIVGPPEFVCSGTTWCTIQDLDAGQPNILLNFDHWNRCRARHKEDENSKNRRQPRVEDDDDDDVDYYAKFAVAVRRHKRAFEEFDEMDRNRKKTKVRPPDDG